MTKILNSYSQGLLLMALLLTMTVAQTAAGSEIWAANKVDGDGSTDGSVTIINAESNTVVASISSTCFSSPESIAANPVRNQVYVVGRTGGSVCVVGASSRAVIGSPIDVGDGPRYAVVTPNGNFVYVSNNESGDVSKINAGDRSTSTIVTGGSPRNMAISPDGSKVYVALQFSSDIAVIDTSNDSVSTITFAGASSTYGVAIDPGTNKGYVSDENNDVVHVFDVTTDTEITGIGYPISDASFDYPRGIAAANGKIYASNADGDDVTIIDTSDDTVITAEGVGNEPRNPASNISGTNMYVPNRHSDSVSVISTSTNAVIATITDASFEEPYAVAAIQPAPAGPVPSLSGWGLAVLAFMLLLVGIVFQRRLS